MDRRNIALAAAVIAILGGVLYGCGRDIGPAEGATPPAHVQQR